MKNVVCRAASAVMLLSLSAGISASEPLYIAGVNPAERPAKAPVIKTWVKTPAWYTQALRGVEKPYPASLRFLEDQGAWYSPFIHPGMTGPYDIRHWHKK